MGDGTDPKAAGETLGRHSGHSRLGRGHACTCTQAGRVPRRGGPSAACGPSLPGGAGTSCSASSWYRAVSNSSRRCFFTTSFLEAAPRVVPTHRYRKFCSKARGCGCADPSGRGSAARAVGNPGQRPLHTAQVSSGRGLRRRRWAQWLLHLPATSPREAAHRPSLPGSGRATRAKRQTRAASDTVKAQETGPKDHVQKTPAGCPPTPSPGASPSLSPSPEVPHCSRVAACTSPGSADKPTCCQTRRPECPEETAGRSNTSEGPSPRVTEWPQGGAMPWL